jgi:recombination protein RecT
MVYDAMNIQELEKTRSASRSKNSPAWSNYTGEMYKKTVIHRLCKHIEIDFESPNQKQLFDDDMKIEVEREKVEVPDIDDDVIDVIDAEDVIVED